MSELKFVGVQPLVCPRYHGIGRNTQAKAWTPTLMDQMEKAINEITPTTYAYDREMKILKDNK
jgi:hypothetical protein